MQISRETQLQREQDAISLRALDDIDIVARFLFPRKENPHLTSAFDTKITELYCRTNRGKYLHERIPFFNVLPAGKVSLINTYAPHFAQAINSGFEDVQRNYYEAAFRYAYCQDTCASINHITHPHKIQAELAEHIPWFYERFPVYAGLSEAFRVCTGLSPLHQVTANNAMLLPRDMDKIVLANDPANQEFNPRARKTNVFERRADTHVGATIRQHARKSKNGLQQFFYLRTNMYAAQQNEIASLSESQNRREQTFVLPSLRPIHYMYVRLAFTNACEPDLPIWENTVLDYMRA